MKKNLVNLLLFCALALVLSGAYFLYGKLGDKVKSDSYPQEQQEEEEKKAADFTVYDDEQNPLKLSDFAGKPVIVNFWASWCPPCRSEMPHFEEAFSAYGGDIVFLMVNLTDGASETVSSAREFIEMQAYTFPIYFDTDFSASNAYEISSIPATYFIDPSGNIAAHYLGSLSKEALEVRIDLIFPEK
ncbi:MAG: TlpA family protein disulfide reductase [Eubacteriaceae bacterium]|nr:TlpA family protein disulfide reductase [Eubacteriaceae bacterium]